MHMPPKLAVRHIAPNVIHPFRQIFLNFVANLAAPVEIINKIQLFRWAFS
jgi:hypothetical protein